MSERVLDVYLPGTTAYVTGTVNGVVVTWTNMGNSVWQAIVAKNVEGVYVISLTLVSQSGMTSAVGMTLFDALSLITDRTAADVARWQELKSKGLANMTAAELAEWRTSKGAYNYTDMNRVEAAVFMIASKLNDIDIPVKVETKSNWTHADLPTAKDFERYLGNVAKLRGASSGLHLAPALPTSMVRLNYIGANNIEAALLFINEWADGMKDTRRYSGEFYGGEW